MREDKIKNTRSKGGLKRWNRASNFLIHYFHAVVISFITSAVTMHLLLLPLMPVGKHLSPHSHLSSFMTPLHLSRTMDTLPLSLLSVSHSYLRVYASTKK